MEAANEIDKLQQELAAMRQLTMTVMTSNGDMGIVVQFLKNSFCVPNYEALGKALLESLSHLGLHGAVTLETYTGRVFVGPEGLLNDEASAAIKADLMAGRIVEAEDMLQINYDSASLRVSGLPENGERIGQLRDSLALLMEGAEARVKSLIMEEKATEARKAKNEFFTLMSNELRIPLDPIIGYAARLEKKLGGNIEDQYRKVIRSIKSNGESLRRLINHIIDLGKLEAGEISVNRRPFNVADAITYATIKAEEYADNDNCRFVKDVNSDLFFTADPPRFIDIVISLIAYAARASSEIHTVTVSATVENHTTQDHIDSNLILTVADDGKLLSNAYKTRIFEFNSDDNQIDLYEANDLGIGLYLTKKLVEMHHGTVTLTHCEEGGSVFTVTIPSDRHVCVLN